MHLSHPKIASLIDKTALYIINTENYRCYARFPIKKASYSVGWHHACQKSLILERFDGRESDLQRIQDTLASDDNAFNTLVQKHQNQ